MSKLQAIRYERGKLELLDQRLLPLESIYIPIRTPQEAFDAIRSMVVRGAPAIGCTAALAVAAWLVERGAGSQYDSAAAAADDVQATTQHLVQRCAGCTRQPSPCLMLPEQQETMTPAVAMWNNRPRPYLRRTMLSYPVCACGLSACLQLRSPVTGTWTVVRIEAAVSLQQARHHSQKQIVAQSCSRPTAVNLADACNKLASIASASAEAPGATPQSVAEAVVMTAEAYYQHDIATCKVLAFATGASSVLLPWTDNATSTRSKRLCYLGIPPTGAYAVLPPLTMWCPCAGRLTSVAGW